MNGEDCVVVPVRLPTGIFSHVEFIARHALVPVEHVAQVLLVLQMMRTLPLVVGPPETSAAQEPQP